MGWYAECPECWKHGAADGREDARAGLDPKYTAKDLGGSYTRAYVEAYTAAWQAAHRESDQ